MGGNKEIILPLPWRTAPGRWRFIAFSRGNGLPAEFEIQLSSGGGQFLTVYSGTVSEYGKLISYTFKGTTASDLRIVLNDDRVGVAE